MAQDAVLIDVVEEMWDIDLVESLYRSGRLRDPEEFRSAIHAVLGGRGRLHMTGSARQGLSILLNSLKAEGQRRRVLLCSFNCLAVKHAVEGAGLVSESFDFKDTTGAIDWNTVGAKLTEDHLAVLVPHFFGVPADFRPLLEPARRKGVRIIEDCAHTLGGLIAGAIAGTIGDAALFSFNYDKPVSLAGGGLILVNDADIVVESSVLGSPPHAEVELTQFKSLKASLKLDRTRNARSGVSSRIAAKLAITPYAMPHLPSGIGALRASVGLWQLERFSAVQEARNRHAFILMQAAGRAGWHVDPDVAPAWLKLRLATGEGQSGALTRECLGYGIAAGNRNWPMTIDRAAASRAPVAAHAARNGIDIPVHQNLREENLCFLAQIARQAEGEPSLA